MKTIPRMVRMTNDDAKWFTETMKDCGKKAWMLFQDMASAYKAQLAKKKGKA